jgi:SAM-dependent methyltransferase
LNDDYDYLPGWRPDLVEVLVPFFERRDDLRKALVAPDSFAYWRWVNLHGIVESERIAQLLPPIPPEALRSIVSSGGVHGFLDGGAVTFAVLDDAARRHGDGLKGFERILDFGCGCGRGLRYLLPYARNCEIHGCDLRAESIEWCIENLPWVKFELTHEDPPLPYGPASFDLIFSISVFSHLSEDSARQWIEELRRVAAPDALVIVTTHGRHALDQLLHGKRKCEDFGLSPEALAAAELRLAEHGFLFFSQSLAGLNPCLYGMAFISREHAMREWSAAFEILEYREAQVHEWQDVFVMRPRKQGPKSALAP